MMIEVETINGHRRGLRADAIVQVSELFDRHDDGKSKALIVLSGKEVFVKNSYDEVMDKLATAERIAELERR